MTREIRIFWNVQAEAADPRRGRRANPYIERERREIAASIRDLIEPVPASFSELAAAEADAALGRPLFSAVVRGDAAGRQSVEVELLNALTLLDEPLELDVTFVPEL
jgi:hypothetical protein